MIELAITLRLNYVYAWINIGLIVASSFNVLFLSINPLCCNTVNV